MTSERETGGRETTRRLRDELARIRTAEAQVEQALQSVRAARRRVEELALSLEMDETRVRELVREELAASGGSAAGEGEPGGGRPSGPAGLPWRGAPEEKSRWARPAAPVSGAGAVAAAGDRARGGPASRPSSPGPRPPVPDAETGADAPGRRERRRLAMVAVAAALTVVVVGWLAFRGLSDGVVPAPIVLSDDAGAPGVAGDPAEADAAGEEAEASAEPSAAGPLATLPGSPEAQRQLYDSLFAARSALFAPLLDSVASITDDGDVEDAVEAWGGSGDLGAKERDLVQSALVQWILKREIDQRVEVDGELLRNPCRGTSCSALLNLWQMGREAFGFPEMPEDAPTNEALLHTVEAMVVLERMQDLHVGEGAAVARPREGA